MKNVLQKILPRRFMPAAPILLIIECPEDKEIDAVVGSKLHLVASAWFI